MVCVNKIVCLLVGAQNMTHTQPLIVVRSICWGLTRGKQTHVMSEKLFSTACNKTPQRDSTTGHICFCALKFYPVMLQGLNPMAGSHQEPGPLKRRRRAKASRQLLQQLLRNLKHCTPGESALVTCAAHLLLMIFSSAPGVCLMPKCQAMQTLLLTVLILLQVLDNHACSLYLLLAQGACCCRGWTLQWR